MGALLAGNIVSIGPKMEINLEYKRYRENVPHVREGSLRESRRRTQ